MNITSKTLSICVSSTVCFIAALMTAPRDQANASIRGQIYDNRFGLAVSGAQVAILLEGRVQQQTRSDQQGKYEFKNLRAGQYAISVESLGFARTERTASLKIGEQLGMDIALRIGHIVDPIRIEISGTVKLRDNTRPSSVTIVIVSPFDKQIAATTTTNQAGQYAVAVDDPGQYVVWAFKPGFKVSAVPVILPPRLPRGRCTLDIVLDPFKMK